MKRLDFTQLHYIQRNDEISGWVQAEKDIWERRDLFEGRVIAQLIFEDGYWWPTVKAEDVSDEIGAYKDSWWAQQGVDNLLRKG